MTHLPVADANRTPLRVPVRFPPASDAAYDILIEDDAITGLGPLVLEAAPSPHYVVITDNNVAPLHGNRVVSSLRAVCERVDLLAFPAGEAHKTRAQWAELTDLLLECGVGRDGCIVALGGGVTGDLAGFVAATYMRGIRCVQLPSTLLAMIDASIGGKTAVDTPVGKNLVGAFLHPRLVVIDPLLLGTLPDRELRAGLAEAVKHGAIADRRYLESIRDGAAALLARRPSALASLIHRSVVIKAGVVARDPSEQGERASLNFGHTIGHALERVSGYALPHGFAVATGMIVEAELGELLGVTDSGTAALLRAALRPLGLPTALPSGTVCDDVIAAAATDKKAREQRTRFALIRRLGEIARDAEGGWTVAVDLPLITRALERVLHDPDSTL